MSGFPHGVGDLLQLPFVVAAEHGIQTGATNDVGAQLNTLITSTSAAGGGLIWLPEGDWIHTSITIVMQSKVGLAGSNSTFTGIRGLANLNADLVQFQCYVPTANAWAQNTAYTRGDVVTFGGNYYCCNVTHTSPMTGTLLSDNSHYYNWTVFSPTSTGAQSSDNLFMNIAFQYGWASSMSPGDFHHAVNFASSVGDAHTQFINCQFVGATGDGFRQTGGIGASGTTVPSNDVRLIACESRRCGGTGFLTVHDNEMAACKSAYHSLGGFFMQYGTANKMASSSAVNIGWAPMFMPTNTTGTGTAGSGATAVTVATLSLTSNMLGQGIYDTTITAIAANGASAAGQKVLTLANTTGLVVGMSVYDSTNPTFLAASSTIASIQAGVSVTLNNNIVTQVPNADTIQFLTAPGAGVIPAGTVISDVTSSTALVLSQATTGVLTAGTALVVGGYYVQPTSTNVNPAMVINGGANFAAGDGIAYIPSAASVLTATILPNSDTTNWMPIRLAIDWGWGYTLYGTNCSENNIHGDAQACLRGAVQLYSTGFSGNRSNNIINLTSGNMASNPVTGTHQLITKQSTPANLMPPGVIGLTSTAGNIVNVANVFNLTGTPQIPLFATVGTNITLNTFNITTDGLENGVGALPTSSNSFNYNGNVSPYSASEIGLMPLDANGTQAFAESVPRALVNDQGLALVSGQGLVAPLYLQAGMTVNNLSFAFQTGAGTGTVAHGWAALLDGPAAPAGSGAFKVLAASGDITTVPANTTKAQVVTFALSTGATPAGTGVYTVKVSGIYYAMFMLSGTLTSNVVYAYLCNQGGTTGYAFHLGQPLQGLVGTGLTTPPTVGTSFLYQTTTTVQSNSGQTTLTVPSTTGCFNGCAIFDVTTAHFDFLPFAVTASSFTANTSVVLSANITTNVPIGDVIQYGPTPQQRYIWCWAT